MNIEINLIQDWENLILQEITELENDGFLFDLDYDDWMNKRRNGLEKDKTRLENDKKSLIDNDEDADSIDSRIAEIDSTIARIERDLACTGLENKHKEELIFNYFNFRERLISNRPRQVKIPRGFSCPPAHQEGLERLLDKVRRGDSLFPHLSRQINNPSFSDGMLFDWGIQHFHLGLTPDKRKPRLIQGTKEVLYAMVSDDYFYALAIEDHNHWTDKDLLRIVRDNFGEIIEPHRLKGIASLSVTVDESDHNKYRQAGINVITELDDKYYLCPGGGITTAKTSTRAVRSVLHTKHRYSDAQNIIGEELQKALVVTPIKENNPLDCIQLKMSELENDRITVKCQEDGTRIVLFFDEQDNFRSLSIQRSYDEGGFYIDSNLSQQEDNLESFALQNLEQCYGEDEPKYSLELIKEHNSNYARK